MANQGQTIVKTLKSEQTQATAGQRHGKRMATQWQGIATRCGKAEQTHSKDRAEKRQIHGKSMASHGDGKISNNKSKRMANTGPRDGKRMANHAKHRANAWHTRLQKDTTKQVVVWRYIKRQNRQIP